MKKNQKMIRRMALRALVWFFAAMVCLTIVSRAAASFTVPRVITKTPEYQAVSHTVLADGTLLAKREMAIVTEADLLVDTVFVSVGQQIAQGEAIASVNLTDLSEKIELLSEEIRAAEQDQKTQQTNSSVALKRAKEDLETASSYAQRAVDKAKEEADSAAAAYQSYQNMLGGRDVTEEEYRQSVALLEEKKAKQEAYEQALRDKETALRDADRAIEDAVRAAGQSETKQPGRELKQKQLKRYQALLEAEGNITAPAAGIVTEMIGRAGQKTTDTAFCMISDLGSGLLFTAQVNKEDAALIGIGDSMTLKHNNQKAEDVTVSAQKTESDGSVTILADVAGTDWVPGSSAAMELSAKPSERGLTVPLSALRSQDGNYYVLVLQDTQTVLGTQKTAVRVDVTVKEKNDNLALVEGGGLSGDSEVITDSDRAVSNGSKVRLWEK